jgi:hypothetical protein
MMPNNSVMVVIVPKGDEAWRVREGATLSLAELPQDVRLWLCGGGVLAWATRRRG